MCTGSDQFGASTSGGQANKMVVASSFLSAYGNYMQGKQAKAFYDYKANQARADADAVVGQATVAARKIVKAGTIQQGAVTAEYGGSGISISSGTALAVRERLQRNISEDATAQLLTGQRKAAQLQAEAVGDEISGKSAFATGAMGATRSLLSGTAELMKSQREQDRWDRLRMMEFKRTKTAEYRAAGGGLGDD